MDTNLVLLWTVGAIWLFGMRNVVMSARQGRPAWLIAYGLTLLGTSVAYVWWRPLAGGVSAALFGGMVLGPILLQRRVARLSASQHFEGARRLARLAAWLHPADGYPELVSALGALAYARKGQIERAERTLEQLANEGNAGIRSLASLYLHRMRGEWSRYLQLTDAVPEATRVSDPSLLIGRLRALGETGQLEQLIAEYGKYAHAPGLAQVRASARLFVAAFAGRQDLVAHLLAGPMGPLDDATREFWSATCAYVAGEHESATSRLQALVAQGEPMIAPVAKRRLLSPPSAAGTLSDAAQRTLAELETELSQEAQYGGGTELAFRPLVTLTLIALNGLAFAIEELLGGSDDSEVLYRVGALATLPGLKFQWHDDAWRLVSAIFLHVGVLHLTMNMLALWMLGPFVERRFGRLRMLVLYLGAGLVGSLWTALVPAKQPQLFLGASGCIMGLLGVTAAVMVHGRWNAGSRVATRRLSGIVLTLAIQVVFDLSVPGISLIAHWSGVAVGFFVGYLFTLSMPQSPDRAH